MKKEIFVFILLFIAIIMQNGCLWSTCQIADTVGKNNLSYSFNGAYTGYLSEQDKAIADSLGEDNGFMFGANINYGIFDYMDLQMGLMGSNFGGGLKISPIFDFPLRFAIVGGLYTNPSNFLISANTGLILSYHASENITFTLGSEVFIFNKNDYTGDIYFSIDLERDNLFQEVFFDNIVNSILPKAVQFNVSYPFATPYDKVYLGISLRYEISFLDFKRKKENAI